MNRFPGRGAWVHSRPECVDRAERRSAFPRALRVARALDVEPVRSYLTGLLQQAGQEQGGVGRDPVPSHEESKVDPS